MSIRLVPLAVASFALGAVALPAQAEVSAQKECGAEYQAAKAANTLNGQNWQQFRKDCLARHAAPAAAPSESPAPAQAAAPAPAPTTPVAAPAPAAPAAAPATAPAPAAPAAAPTEAHMSVQKECGAEYQAAKTAGSLNGQTWQQFLQACRTRHAGPAAAPAAPAEAPAAPAAAPAKPAAEAPAGSATTKAGKPISPGMQAFIAREKQCGAEWRANQAAIKKTNPKATWPSYLSECNKRLKAQGH